jgi:hypothetical protein
MLPSDPAQEVTWEGQLWYPYCPQHGWSARSGTEALLSAQCGSSCPHLAQAVTLYTLIVYAAHIHRDCWPTLLSGAALRPRHYPARSTRGELSCALESPCRAPQWCDGIFPATLRARQAEKNSVYCTLSYTPADLASLVWVTRGPSLHVWATVLKACDLQILQGVQDHPSAQ